LPDIFVDILKKSGIVLGKTSRELRDYSEN
jgi:hypothetical protein